MNAATTRPQLRPPIFATAALFWLRNSNNASAALLELPCRSKDRLCSELSAPIVSFRQGLVRRVRLENGRALDWPIFRAEEGWTEVVGASTPWSVVRLTYPVALATPWRMASDPRTAALFLLLSGVFGPSLAQAETPELARPYVLGVNIHQSQLLRNATGARTSLQFLGAQSIRTDLAWPAFGHPDAADGFPPVLEPLHNFVAALHDSEPLFILDIGNPAFDGGNQPISPEAQSAYVEYSKRAILATSQYTSTYEIWNEWNVGTGTQSQTHGLPQDYVPLVRKTFAELHKERPKLLLLAGAVGEIEPGWPWLTKAFGLGLMKYADGLSVHLYNHCDHPQDRTADEMIARLRSLRHQEAAFPEALSKPVFITEMGWPHYDGYLGMQGSCSLSDQEIADNFSEFFLLLPQLSFVRGVWIYDLTDDGTDTTKPENGFGLFTFDFAPKPAACAVAEAYRFVRDAKFVRVLHPTSGATEVDFMRGPHAERAIWSDKNVTTISIRIKGETTVHRICGNTSNGYNATANLSPTPLLITDADRSRITFSK
jgi:hypothetical protein